MLETRTHEELATPFWFGPSDRRLFGWLHLPAGQPVRGGVVLLPPLGIELTVTYSAYRTLASRLANEGLAALRFDYDGTGDSAGDADDPDRVSAWLRSAAAATEVLRAAGVDAIGLVGIRMGGLFGAQEARRLGGVEALVLWDTCLSGHSFLREQRALRLLSLGGQDQDGTVEAPGVRFSRSSVEALSRLDMGKPGERLADKVLVLERPGQPSSARLSRRLDGHQVTWLEAKGQESFLDAANQASQLAEHPELADWTMTTVKKVADWLATAVRGEPVWVTPPASNSALVCRAPSGEAVHERPVIFGPGLFGIVTEPERPRPGPAAIFISEANTPHIGQARLWVELARAWGMAGLRTLRFDLSGRGDSAAHPGQTPADVFDPEIPGDVLEAMRLMSPQPSENVILLGLCSAAYHAMEVAFVEHPRRICLINPAAAFVPPQVAAGRPSLQRRAAQATRGWFVAAARRPAQRLARRMGHERADEWESALVTGLWPIGLAAEWPRIPRRVWWLLTRLLITDTPAVTFQRLARAGVDTFVVSGSEDLPRLVVGNEALLARLQRSSRFRLDVLEDLDHSALIVDSRSRLKRTLTEYVLSGLPSQERPEN